MKTISCELWSINKWLRWLGVRVFVVVNEGIEVPTKIGLVFGWRGWPDLILNEKGN